MKKLIEKSNVKVSNVRNVDLIQYFTNDYLKAYAENLEGIEPETLDWIDTFENESVFYDIGALSGPFSLYAAIKKQCKIFAFEPEAQNFAILEMNHFLNKKTITHPFVSLNFALSDKNEIGKLYMSRNDPGSTVKILDHPKIRMNEDMFEPGHIQYVVKQKLDNIIKEFNLPLPKYMKIDVDGSEEGVLKGAKGILAKDSIDSILIEILKPEDKSKHIVKFLEKFGYELTYKKQVEDYVGLYNCIFTKS